MRTSILTACLSAAAVLAACTGVSASKSVAVASSNGACSTQSFEGSGGTGDSCTDAKKDCAPVCCDCNSGSNRFSASACSLNKCEDSQAACSDAQSTAKDQGMCP